MKKLKVTFTKEYLNSIYGIGKEKELSEFLNAVKIQNQRQEFECKMLIDILEKVDSKIYLDDYNINNYCDTDGFYYITFNLLDNDIIQHSIHYTELEEDNKENLIQIICKKLLFEYRKRFIK